MGRRAWWPWARTLILAHLFGLFALGLAQFMLSPIDNSYSCVQPSSPEARVVEWARSAMTGDLAGEFDGHDRGRLALTLGALAPLGGLLAWSARSLRRWPRLRVGTLMVLVAAVALEWSAGRLAWSSWGRWDNYRRQADGYAAMEATYRERFQAPASPDDEMEAVMGEAAAAEGLACAEEYRRLRRVYERAVWRPWHELDEAEVWPGEPRAGPP